MELVSYAIDFVSYLVQNLKKNNLEKIKSIILFGSAARGEAGKESDVDIFIDIIPDNEKKIKKEIDKINEDFFDSVKYTKYWKYLGIDNEFQVVLGKINQWKLKNSMVGNSVILYGPYSPKLEEGKNMIILSWDAIKNNSRRVMINKKLFGYNHYGKRYKGIIEVYNGKKLGTNAIILPAENLNLSLKIFHSFKIPVKIKRVFEYKE
jgi:predicted nucleotidyltransferase